MPLSHGQHAVSPGLGEWHVGVRVLKKDCWEKVDKTMGSLRRVLDLDKSVKSVGAAPLRVPHCLMRV